MTDLAGYLNGEPRPSPVNYAGRSLAEVLNRELERTRAPAPTAQDIIASIDTEKPRTLVGMAQELGLDYGILSSHYEKLIADPTHQVPAPIETNRMMISAAPPVGLWQRFKEFFVPQGPIPWSDMDRAEKADMVIKQSMGLPLRTVLGLARGMTLSAPDLLWAAVKRITPPDTWTEETRNMSLEQALDWAAGYDPSGLEKAVGAVANFVGQIRTVSPLLTRLKILTPEAAKYGWLTKAAEEAKLWGSAGAAKQIEMAVAEKLDPTEADYGYEGANAVLFDAAAGFGFSLLGSGARAIWRRFTLSDVRRVATIFDIPLPAELREALKVEGAEREKIAKSFLNSPAGDKFQAEVGAKVFAYVQRNFPTTDPKTLAKYYRNEIGRVVAARDTIAREAWTADVVESWYKTTETTFRGRPLTIRPPSPPEAELAAYRERLINRHLALYTRWKNLEPGPEQRQIGQEIYQVLRMTNEFDGVKDPLEGRPFVPPEMAAVHEWKLQEAEGAKVVPEQPAAVTAVPAAPVEPSPVLNPPPPVPPTAGTEIPQPEGPKVEAPKVTAVATVKPEPKVTTIEDIRRHVANPSGEREITLFEQGPPAQETKPKETAPEAAPAAGQEVKHPWEMTVSQFEDTADKYAGRINLAYRRLDDALDEMYQKIGPDPRYLWPDKQGIMKQKAKQNPNYDQNAYMDWVNRRDAYDKENIEPLRQRLAEIQDQYEFPASHRLAVQKANAEGKPIPRHVLEEYKSEPWAQEALAKLGAPPAATQEVTGQAPVAAPTGKQILETAEPGKPVVPPTVAEQARGEPLTITPQTEGFLSGESGEVSLEKLAAITEAVADPVQKAVESLQFYPKAPPQFRNAVRTDVVGGIGKALKYVYSEVGPYLWGGLGRKEIDQTVKIIYARDMVARRLIGKGDPRLTVAEAQESLRVLESAASPKAMDAARRWREIHDTYTKQLVDQGLLDEEGLIPDHVRHYTTKYLPDWAPTRGLPKKLRTPMRGYTRTAGETTMQYRQNQDSLLQSLVEMEYDNLMEDFIKRQATIYDVTPNLTPDQKFDLFGVGGNHQFKSPKPGRLYEIDGKWYRAYSPDAPYNRVIARTDEGQTLLLGYKKTYLVPEEIYDLFQNFSDRGAGPLYYVNRATAYWKSMAIFSHLPGFTINNLIGDTWLAAIQHPEPTRLLREYTTAIDYLLGRGKNDPFMQALSKWMTEESIEYTFASSELSYLRNAQNPVGWLLNHVNNFENAREMFNRVAYGASGFRALQEGRGAEWVALHDWVDTAGLNTSEAVGKIARETMTDYSAVSKAWRRYISGLLFPFGSWTFKNSLRMARWIYHHPVKSTMVFGALPVASTVFNNRSDEIVILDSRLPDRIRNRVHFVLGSNPDGTTRVVNLQLPQDALMGTKIFSIAADYANRAIHGELSPQQAAVETLKSWGIREEEGLVNLTGPLIRFIHGLIDKRDPYDKAPVYAGDPEQMSTAAKLRDEFLYFVKSSVPYLGMTIQSYEKGLPPDVGLRKLLNSWAGKGAFGVYDVTPQAQIQIERDGRTLTLDWDDFRQMKKAEQRQYHQLEAMRRDFIDSGQKPTEFIHSPKYRQSLLNIYEAWSDQLATRGNTVLPKSAPENTKIIIVQARLADVIRNRLTDPRTLSLWYQTKQARAKTETEKQTLFTEYQQKIEIKRLEESLKGLSRSTRALYFLHLLEDNDIGAQEQ